MLEEHHINSFDAGTFHKFHDYDGTGSWSPDDIKRTHGLFDPSVRDVSESKRAEVVQKVMELYDDNRSSSISFAEFTMQSAKGVQLPDFGLGSGHHGDDEYEYEYEILHFEKYHGDDAKEEDLTPLENIEHFRKYEEMEREQTMWEEREKAGVVEENIPQKFRWD